MLELSRNSLLGRERAHGFCSPGPSALRSFYGPHLSIAHELDIFIPHADFWCILPRICHKRNDTVNKPPRLLNLFNADNNRAAPTSSGHRSSGHPSFYAAIASGMSPVHVLSLSENLRVCLKGQGTVSKYDLFTYSPVFRDPFRWQLSSNESSDNDWLARRFPDVHRKLDGPPFPHSSIQVYQKLSFTFAHMFSHGSASG